MKINLLFLLLVLYLLASPLLALAQDEEPESEPEPINLENSLLVDNNGSGTLEVDAYGDSITRGVGDFIGPGQFIEEVFDADVASIEAGYPLRIETLLGLSVSNRGNPGERLSTAGVGRICRDIQARRPDVATISGGSNDTISRTSSEDIFHSYQTIINVAKAVGTNPVLVTIPPICCNRRERNAFVVAYNNAIRELAGINSLTLADANKAFLNTCNLNSCRLLNVPEGLHPNISGYDVMGETVTASLLNINIFDVEGQEMFEEALNLAPGAVLTVPDPTPEED